MARRKKRTHRRKSRGRRRVGALSQNTSQTLALGGGVVMGVLATRFAKKFIPAPVDPTKAKSREYMVAAGEVVAGGALAYYAQNPLLKGIGIGIAAGGALQAGQASGIISGIGAIGDTLMLPMSGTRSMPRIASSAASTYPSPPAIGKPMGSLIG